MKKQLLIVIKSNPMFPIKHFMDAFVSKCGFNLLLVF